MRSPRAFSWAPAVATVVIVALSGCNDDDPGDPDDAAAPATESSTPTSTATSTTSTPPSTPAEPTTSAPPPSPPASENAMPDVCGVVTPQQMSDVLFFPVELTTSDGSCRYAVPDDAAAPAVQYVQTPGFTAADVAEAKDTAVQRTGGRLQPIENVGDDAFFAVGPDDSGQLTGSGGVLVGDTFVEVTLTQSMDQIEPEVGQAMIDAVGLAGDALGG